MDTGLSGLRQQTIEKILAMQDDQGRWAFNEKQVRERPEHLYYSPNFKSTLWTLVYLADLKAPANPLKILPSIRLITDHFYDRERGISRLPGGTRFPIPCLNGNMLYLVHFFETANPELSEKTIEFFASYQRFDDGDFKTPQTYPYCSNRFCYGKHTCYWGVTKLLKGLSFVPKSLRSGDAKKLIDRCIEFVLQHEVCFSSHHPEDFLHRDVVSLTFPNFYKSDFLEILWLLAREEVHDRKLSRSLELLRSRRREDGFWDLEKPVNVIVPIGRKGHANVFVSDRAMTVLDYYG